MRVRCFAAFGLGLLGDQPAGEEGSDSGSGAANVTRELFSLLEEDYGNPELEVSVLMAIGLQKESSFTDEQRQVLRDCVQKQKLGKRTVKGIAPAHAALALGKIGTANDVTLLSRALTSRRSDRWLQSSAAIGHGQARKPDQGRRAREAGQEPDRQPQEDQGPAGRELLADLRSPTS